MRTELRTNPKHVGRAGAVSAPLLLLAVIIIAVVGFVVISNRRPGDGPLPVIWDKTPCSFCAMHVGDPRFAAQLTTEEGTTHFYDDPGCLFLHERQLAADQAAVRVRWFHELESEGWIAGHSVAFQRSEFTPMDYGFGAVPQGSPLAVSLEQAAAEVLAK